MDDPIPANTIQIAAVVALVTTVYTAPDYRTMTPIGGGPGGPQTHALASLTG